ncbi:MAG: cytochrome b/b6 domain-containing protein [Planctomycetota bacterium]|jgi:hypothetical protein
MPQEAIPSRETQTAWGSTSLLWTLIGTAFLFLTGLVILLAPFSTGAQVTVLIHTVAGVVFLVPLLVYLIPHLKTRWRDSFSHLVLLGWSSGALMGAAVVTGIVLTVQAMFGRRIDYGWDLVHTITGCAVFGVLGAHLVTAVRRNRPGESSFVFRRLGATGALGLLFTVTVFVGGAQLEESQQRQALPEGYSFRYGDNPFAPSMARTDWLWRIDRDHEWLKFLASKPTPDAVTEFLDRARKAHAADVDLADRGEAHVGELDGLAVDARRIQALSADPPDLEALAVQIREDMERHKKEFETSGGIAPPSLAGSRSCGTTGCHEEILAEWEPSAHRYSSRSAFFQLIQGAMAESNGAESTRYCAGCHDPIALFSGAKNIYSADDDLSTPGADEGISCAACHSMVRTDVGGNANYVLAPPERYLWEDSAVGRFLIRAYPRKHRESFARPLLSTPEFCGACHKQFIDKELNRSTRVQLQNQYDSWRGSHWFVADPENPTRADPDKSLACNDCHMRLTGSTDPTAPGEKHRHHGFIAAGQWLPLLHDLPHAKKHVELTEQWLRGETVIPEIADRWPGGPPVPIEIQVPETVRPGEKVKIRIVADNRKVGHAFPTGPLDVIQAWFDIRVTRDGKEIFRSGALDKEGFIQEGAFQLKAEGVDRAGNLIDRHNLWDMVGARFRRVLFPGYSDQEEFTFECACEAEREIKGSEADFPAPTGEGELVVTAILRYRKVDQTLLNVLFPDGNVRAPVTDMTKATARIRVVNP